MFLENVGNLVCPAIYDLGQAACVVALSVTEGEDKPLKYPVMFRRADLVVLTKMDLLPHLDVDLHAIEDALARTMPNPRLLKVSAKTGEGIRPSPPRARARARPPHDHPDSTRSTFERRAVQIHSVAARQSSLTRPGRVNAMASRTLSS